jgi:cell division protein ZapA (FtsZ GTPase activity inhibitor)
MKNEAMNYDEENARNAVRELDPFLLHIRQAGASESDVPVLAAIAVSSALLALVGEVRMLRESLQAKDDLAESVSI